jgi:predicted adenylyl cyclase CyaB
MGRNVEIKARVSDLALIQKRAEMIADSRPSVTKQEDTFFQCPNGYLKLRRFSETEGELIYYQRPDSAEARESQYIRSPSHDPRSLCEVLSNSLGVRGVIRKRRTLYIVGQTRIHLDDVENLGSFVEIEVVLSPQQTVSVGIRIVNEIMEKLGISRDDLVEKAYIELLKPTDNKIYHM